MIFQISLVSIYFFKETTLHFIDLKFSILEIYTLFLYISIY